MSTPKARKSLFLLPLLLASPLALAQAPAPEAKAAPVPEWTQNVSPEAARILTRMSAYMDTLQDFTLEADTSRDEVVARGYKLQHNEHSVLQVQRPGRLRAEVRGDMRNRDFLFADGRFVINSIDDKAWVGMDAPATIATMLDMLIDQGIDLPMIDMLYQAAQGNLANEVNGGVWVGETRIDGVPCDQLAFRQDELDWQIWIEKGERPLPRKMLVTTRYELGAPQFQATMRWNLAPKFSANTFRFTPPAGAVELRPAVAAAPAPAGAK